MLSVVLLISAVLVHKGDSSQHKLGPINGAKLSGLSGHFIPAVGPGEFVVEGDGRQADVNTLFGLGRYAPEYAALCVVYNLKAAIEQQIPDEKLNPPDWQTLISKLEYLAVSLAPENGEWCKEDKPETKAGGKATAGTATTASGAWAKTGSLLSAFVASAATTKKKGKFMDTKYGSYTVEDCEDKIKKIKEAIAVNEKKIKAKTTPDYKIPKVDLIFTEHVNGSARDRAFRKVLKLLLKAKGEKAKYEDERKKATKVEWDTQIKAKINEIAFEKEAKSIGHNGDNAGDTENLLKCTKGGIEDGCPSVKTSAATNNMKIMCMPGQAATDFKSTKGDGNAETLSGDQNKFRAGHNILVDMACLCIPANGKAPVTACTGTQPIEVWPNANTNAPLKGHIQNSSTAAKSRNNYGKITAHTIEQALENFKKVLGRWQNTESTYVLATPGAKKCDGATNCENDKPFPGVLEKAKPAAVCDGTAGQHCVNYVKFSGDAPQKADMKNGPNEEIGWMKALKDAKKALSEYESALQKTSSIKHKIDILTEAAIQARDEALLGDPVAQVATDFGVQLKDFCGKHNATECGKFLVCAWDETKCTVATAGKLAGVVTSVTVDPAQLKEFQEKVETCQKLNESEEKCKTDATNCKWDDAKENKCIPIMETPIRAPAQPGRSHTNPTFLYPLFFF